MPQLLLELLSEEIPARMQAGAARDLSRMLGERLGAAGLAWDTLHAYAGPRRLTLVADGLPAATPDRAEELKGPKASAPPQAVDGFLRKTGLAREALSERDGVLYATLSTAGRPTREIVAEALGEVMRGFPWPKSMRSGTSSFRWVRPLKGVLLLFDGAVVPFAIDGIAAGDTTRGHRFMGSRGAPFAVTGFDDYRAGLEREFVVLDAADRRRRILEGARAACASAGLELVEDAGLLEEVAGLAEWPTPVLGAMDPAFLDLPPEVIATSMRTHQKYFAVRAPGGEGLAPRFVVVANVEAADGGAALAAGNARVLSARLNDARFFWDEDRKPGAFERWLGKLEGVTFHAKLGSMAERVARIEALAREIAPLVGADPQLAAQAARLCKADLASAMVGEFPELQGVMGGYYARLSPLPLDGGEAGRGGEAATLAGAHEGSQPDPERSVSTPIPGPSPIEGEGRRQVADAVRDHYKPVGPSDTVPTAPVTVAVALADKLDTLVGFFAIGETPTGSKDPYALRRAALGVIRLVVTLAQPLSLRLALAEQWPRVFKSITRGKTLQLFEQNGPEWIQHSFSEIAELERSRRPYRVLFNSFEARSLPGTHEEVAEWPAYVLSEWQTIDSNVAFFADRLKILLRDEGRRHDLVDAVFALGDDDLVRIVARVEALSGFLATEDGANLLAGYRRGANILKAEAKKHPDERVEGEAADRPGSPPEQVALQSALRTALARMEPQLAAEDFAGAMASLAALRAPVDAFFERVLVNDPDPPVRLDRLRLLSTLRDAANRVADFSLIQG